MEYKETFIQVIVNTLKELSKVDFAYEELDARSQYKSLKEITSQISIYGDDHEGMIILNSVKKSWKMILLLRISAEN